VTLTDIEAAIEAAAAPTKPKPPVSSDASMQDAGLFSLLSLDTIACIMQDLTLYNKLLFAIEVCKGLRPLRQVEALWTRFAIVEPDHSHYHEVTWINGKGLLRLADWLPNRGAVTELALHVSKSISVSDVSAVLQQFGHVEHLRLTGQGVLKKLLIEAHSTPRPLLRELVLDYNQVGTLTVLNMLKQCPGLDLLASQKLDLKLLEGLASQLRDARGGGVPLLSRLRETSGFSSGELGLYGCCALGGIFPELRELSVGGFGLRGPSPQIPSSPLCLPNLRILRVQRMCTSFVSANSESPHLSSGCLGSILRLLIRQCPRLEALSLGHGRKYASRNEVMPPFPRLGTALADPSVGLPEGLVMLHLSDMLIDPSEVLGIALAHLTFVRFVACGPDAQAAADTLATQCPALTSQGCCVREWTGPNATPVPRDAPNAARLRARLYRHPQEPLAGLSLEGVLDVLERGESVTSSY
jgi:hypothetical protein